MPSLTVIFSDLVGSTEIGERLDPEALRRVFALYYKDMRAAVESCGGTVQKFIGDATLATFDVDGGKGALQALRAAEEMRNRCAHLNVELQARWGIRIRTRTGVATGEVAVGDASGSDSLLVGGVVEIATRLERSAGTDEILLDEATARLAGTGAKFEPVELPQGASQGRGLCALRLIEVASLESRTARTSTPDDAREQRKTVTVVFCDLASSLSEEQLDPESLHRVLSRYHAAMRSELERHGGTVGKYVGDALMAVFGIPTRHEDDALRAIRAAAGMHDALELLNRELEADWGVRIEHKIGINTGEVIAGDLLRGEPFVVGDAVNVGARLEQTARPGGIVIGEATYHLVRGAVKVNASVPLNLKGKSEPFPAFDVSEVSRTGRARSSRIESSLVARRAELNMLEVAFKSTVRETESHLITVLGSAGIGKSRLADEFGRKLIGQAQMLKGSCLSYGEGVTYWPVAEIVRRAAGMMERDSPADVRAKIETLLPDDPDASRIAEGIAGALGVSASFASLDETFWAIRKFIEALADEVPLVVVFDDIHWGEPTFLDLIEHLARGTHSAVLFLCLARPDLLERRPGFGAAVADAQIMELAPLNEHETRRLVLNLLDEATLPEDVSTKVADNAGGIPLYVQEVLRTLVDRGHLRRDNGRWRAKGDFSDVEVPSSIEALLAARIDRLLDEERATLERGSVIGQEFWSGAVRELTPESVQPLVDSNLGTLVEKQLVHPHVSTFADESGYQFEHALMRDVAYGGLLKESRSHLHERFASWLERKVAERLPEYEEIVGYHLEQANRFRTEIGAIDEAARDVGSKAAAHLASAGRRALARGDMPAAASLLSRSTALLPEHDRFRLALMPDLGEVLVELGQLERADRLLEEAIGDAIAQADAALEHHCRIVRLLLQLMLNPEGRIAEARREVQRAVPVLTQAGDDRTLAKAWRLAAQASWMACRGADTESAARSALAHAERAGDQRERAQALACLAAVLWFGPTPVPEAIERTQTLFDEANADPGLESVALGSLALLHAMAGQFEEAWRFRARAKAIIEEFGMHLTDIAGDAQVVSDIAFLAEDPATAEEALRRGYEALLEIGEKSLLSTISARLAQALERSGRDDEAEELTHVSEETAATDDVVSQVLWRRTRAKVLARRGAAAEGESLAREAVSMAAKTDSLDMQGDALMDLAEVLALVGRAEEATETVDEALPAYERKKHVVGVRRASAFRAELCGTGPRVHR